MSFVMGIAVSLCLASSAFSQINATTLRAKYGTPLDYGQAPNTETFNVRNNIEIVGNYGPGAQVCRIELPRIGPTEDQVSSAAKQRLNQVLDELVPLSIRGKEIRSMQSQMGLLWAHWTEYENLTIVEVGPRTKITVTFKGDGCGTQARPQ